MLTKLLYEMYLTVGVTSALAMAVGASPTINQIPSSNHPEMSVETMTATWQETMLSNSGTLTSGQVIQVTQATTKATEVLPSSSQTPDVTSVSATHNAKDHR